MRPGGDRERGIPTPAARGGGREELRGRKPGRLHVEIARCRAIRGTQEVGRGASAWRNHSRRRLTRWRAQPGPERRAAVFTLAGRRCEV